VNKITKTVSKYPSLLKHIHKPPENLYYRGDLGILDELCIAIVGTRRPTSYGEEMVDKIVSDFSLCNVVVVSGLALGIDTFAHKAAMRYGLKTAAVLGTGISNVYPPANRELVEEIVQKGGVVVSEYAGDAPARDFQFPMRNRIIAGLSVATIVIEAPEKSGALITARFALEENREVFAVPGDVDREESCGCNKLIQNDGARLCFCGGDVVRGLSCDQKLDFGSGGDGDCGGGGGCGGGILEFITKRRAVHFDKLAEKSGLSAAEINKQLSMLEISGQVYSTNSGFYIRT